MSTDNGDILASEVANIEDGNLNSIVRGSTEADSNYGERENGILKENKSNQFLEHSSDIDSRNLKFDVHDSTMNESTVSNDSTQNNATKQDEDVQTSSIDLPNNDRPSAKKSGSFLSKITSSTSSNSSDNNTSNKKQSQTSIVTNIPASFANLISSVSFSSGFRGSSSTQGTNNNSILDQSATKLTIETASTSTNLSLTSETREQILNTKATLERKNLINLTKLIVKDLISSSFNVGRTIDDNHQCAIHLNNYFTLLDRVLKHGLKQNILTNKAASLWNALDNLPKYFADRRLTSETVRSLAHTKTPDGKIKAWLRIAMMQKKLPEYFNELLANKNVLLGDIYHDYAFMMNDEAHVFAGLIIGVNVIDCNFFVKDDNFDTMDEVIDLSHYLRAANCYDEEDDNQLTSNRSLVVESESGKFENLSAILDQKSYLEERSGLLESTISNLREKIKQLEEQNSRLEMEAKVNEVIIQKLQDVNKPENSTGDKLLSSTSFPIPGAFKSLMSPSNESKSNQYSSETYEKKSEASSNELNSSPSTFGATEGSVQVTSGSEKLEPQSCLFQDTDEYKKLMVDLEKHRKLAEDREKELTNVRERVGILEISYRGTLEKIRSLERDLDVQTSMNKDKETTIKIYEKDLREKQSLVESLRTSLNDSKKLNSDINTRLTDTSAKLKDRLCSVTSLQTNLDKWKLENKTLANHLNEKQSALNSMNAKLEQAMKSIEELKKYNEKINDDLRKERECGQSSSITVETQTTRISELTEQLKTFEEELNELKPYREQMLDFKKRCQDYEQSLEEVGDQLRESRLEVERLKENSSVFLDSQWMDSRQVKSCALCQQMFSVTRRKHHCRLCGNVFCQTCSDNKMELASSAKPARVCDTCHAFLLAKFVKSASSSTSISSTSASIM